MNETAEQISSVPAWAIGGFAIFILVVLILAYIVNSFLLSLIFKKAGVQQWKAWVPIYQYWPLLEMGGQSGLWAILLLVPVINIVSNIFIYIAMYHIGIKFGKDSWFIVLAIFIPLLWMGWLAFDSSKWPKDKQKVLITGGVKD